MGRWLSLTSSVHGLSPDVGRATPQTLTPSFASDLQYDDQKRKEGRLTYETSSDETKKKHHESIYCSHASQ